MKNDKKIDPDTLKKILKIAIAVLTALAGALGVSSCIAAAHGLAPAAHLTGGLGIGSALFAIAGTLAS